MGRKTGARCYRTALQHSSINELKAGKRETKCQQHKTHVVGLIKKASAA
jgi:hypothetical protein